MPPKRKAAATKATEVVENGSESTEPTKSKRGKVTKQAEKVDKPDVEDAKKTRSTRAKAAPVSEKITTEAENKKEKKGRGKAPTQKVAVDEASDNEAPAKKGTIKKKETKSQKDTKQKVVATEPKNSAKATPKAKRARRAKKDDAEDEPEPSKEKAKSRKAAATVTSENASASDEPKTKKPRGKAIEPKNENLQNPTNIDYSKIDFACTKENPTGELPNFKIASWNVDGLRAWMKKNGMEYIEREHPNILCLQEIKCSTEKIPDELNKIKDYKSYWCCSKKEGYAGVALFTIEEPLSVAYGIENEEFDEEGRCITAEYENFYVVNVYVPNAGRGLVTLPKRLEWNTIFNEYVAKLDEQKPVIICGDMNVAHNEIDLTNPKTNKKNAGFTVEEREGMTDFLSNKYIDTYRNLYPDQTNAYTFWSYMNKARSKNIGWRLDYFIVSARFLDNVCDNVIRSNIFGSDHCPIVLHVNV